MNSIKNVQVVILMATYNGEKYLPVQLDSILNQSFQDWVLLISDDGSSDNTQTIIKKYHDKYPDKIQIIDKDKPTGSAKKNFLFLTQYAEHFPYVMYCDQDDFWSPNKISDTLDAMKRLEGNDQQTPCLVHTDLEVVDQNLNTLSMSFFKFSGLDFHKCDLNHLLIQNIVTGCTMMINHSLWKKIGQIKNVDSVLMHDWWFALIAAAMGKIGFVDKATIKYRQHGDNSVGAKNTKDINYISSQIKKGNKNRIAMENTMRQAHSFLQVYSAYLDDATKKMLSDYSSLLTRNKIQRILTVNRYHIWKTNPIRKVAEIFYL